MKKLLPILFVVSLSSPTFAESFYTGAGVHVLDIDATDNSFTVVAASGGYRLNDWLSFEGRLGVSDEEKEEGDGDSLQISLLSAAYVKLSARSEVSSFAPYLLLGYSNAEFTAKFGDGAESQKVNFSDGSFGLGMDYMINEAFSVNGEYIRYFEKESIDLMGFGINLHYVF